MRSLAICFVASILLAGCTTPADLAATPASPASASSPAAAASPSPTAPTATPASSVSPAPTAQPEPTLAPGPRRDVSSYQIGWVASAGGVGFITELPVEVKIDAGATFLILD